MKRIRTHRPSPAMGVALVALFVALGGVSYGFATGSIDSREIADNTIRSKDVRNNNLRSRDLRNNDIRGIDIRNRTLRRHDIALDTLTGNEIRESKLDQVPSAALADRAADAELLAGVAPDAFLRKPEPVHLVGAPGEPPFAPGISASPGDLPPGFWKDGAGLVHLQGTVSGGIGKTDLFVLPVGYRPAASAHFAIAANGGATVLTVAPDGTVTGDPNSSIDGTYFRAGP